MNQKLRELRLEQGNGTRAVGSIVQHVIIGFSDVVFLGFKTKHNSWIRPVLKSAI